METKSENINELATALAKAQKEISNPRKDSKNPYFKSDYSSLSCVLSVVRGVLPNHGLSFTQPIEIVNEKVYLTTILMHTSGQWIKSYAPIICKDPTDPQKFGSSLAYQRRYGVQSIVGIVGSDEDDDGNAACKGSSGKDDNKIVAEFLEKWSKEYGREGVVNFIKERSAMFSMEERAMVKIYRQNDEGFVKEIKAWIAKKMEEQDSEEATLQK